MSLSGGVIVNDGFAKAWAERIHGCTCVTYGLFNDAFISSGSIASNDRMNN
jgi:hypothetical protein